METRPRYESIVSLIPGHGPRRDPGQAYAGLHGLADGLSKGTVTVDQFHRQLPTLDRELAAALDAPQAPPSSRAFLAHARRDQLSVEDIVDGLRRHARLHTTATASLSLDQEHVFEMDYAPGGGFRGSRSYEKSGETHVLTVETWQRDGCGADDPAVVRLRYTYPAHLGVDVQGTPLEERSSADALYFVKRRADVAGLENAIAQKNVVGVSSVVSPAISQLAKSAEQLSPVGIANVTYGFGRVGTSYHEEMKLPVDFRPPEASMGTVAALLTEHALTDVLGLNATVAPAPRPELSMGTRALRGAGILGALGGVAAGVGLAARAMFGPIGLALSAAITGGLALAGGAAFAAGVDGEILKANGATDADVKTERVKAFALGAVTGLAVGATGTLVATPLAAVATTAGFAATGALVATA